MLLPKKGSHISLILLFCFSWLPTPALSNTPITDDQAVLWVSDRAKVLGLDGQTGSQLRSLDDGAYALAVDEQARILWRYQNGALSARRFDGTAVVSTAVEAPGLFANSQLVNGKMQLPSAWSNAFKGQSSLPVPADIQQRTFGSGRWIDLICGSSAQLVVDRDSSDVWLSLCGTLYHYSATAELLGQINIPGRMIEKIDCGRRERCGLGLVR